MKLILVALLALSGCSSCTKLPIDLSLPGIPEEIDPSLALSTPEGGGGHACPVTGEVVTAAHVMRTKNGQYSGATYTYKGQEGYASVAGVSPFKDLILLSISGSVDFLERGGIGPGDRVYWFEYDFRTQENALRARRRTASVLRKTAGLVIFDGAPTPGASGSCLISTEGKVVGIISFGFKTEDGRPVGGAVTLP